MLLRAVGDPVCTTPLIVAVSFPIETARLDIFGVVDLNHVTYSNRCPLKPISTLTCIEASNAREDEVAIGREMGVAVGSELTP